MNNVLHIVISLSALIIFNMLKHGRIINDIFIVLNRLFTLIQLISLLFYKYCPIFIAIDRTSVLAVCK